ncbi:MAG TPA: YXWGXW repeat-containing protein, partial [Pirellulales bacterium]
MRPRLHRMFLAILFALAFGLSWIVNGFTGPLVQLDVATASAADAPAPGDMAAPSLIPPAPAPGDDSSTTPKGAEVLSQGPIHEAFAKPLDLDPQPGPVVKKQPPDPIKEIPPAEQPEGDNIVWIPGYWSWDDDRTDFIWVSGVLRAAPPGQTWVPGYWNKADGGFQWTPGLWTSTAKQEVSYLPQPPQSLENGPSSPQPADNQFWIPGTYVYQNSDYLWRPGYWTVARPNWIWIPAHYSWTPGGYVFINGYWDYELTRRGCLFAPVYFAQPIYAQPAFVWTPSVVFNIGLFNDCLFVRPSYCSYYFGDYFAPRYAGIGFSPWFSITIGSRPRCDPLFTYYRWHNSINDRNWLAHTQQHFDTLRRDEALRPAHTFAAQQQWMKNNPGAKGANMALVSSLKDVAKDPGKSDFKFHEVSLADRKALANKGNELQQVALDRDNIETKNKAKGFGGQSGAGLNGQKNNLGLANQGAGAGGNAGTANLGKFKLPTAAASNMKLSANNQGNNQDQAGNGLGQRGNDNGQKFNNRNLGQNAGNDGQNLGENNGAQVLNNNLSQNKNTGKNLGGAGGAAGGGGGGNNPILGDNNADQKNKTGGPNLYNGYSQNDNDSNPPGNFRQGNKAARSNLILPDNSSQGNNQGGGG